MTDAPSFSVVIPTFNRSDVVARTLELLIAQDYPPDRYEILVCDNSTDATPDMVRRLARSNPNVTLVSCDDGLPAKKRNVGLRLATGDYVLFANDDVWFSPRLLQSHAETHEAAGRPVAVLGHVEQSPAMPSSPFLEWYRPFSYDEIAPRARTPVPYRYSWSMNLSFPRRLLLDRNLVFHEDWANIGHEDVELGWRWTQAGYDIIYQPDALGEHYHPHDLDSACRLQESIGRGIRDLEVLVPDPGLKERYGVFSWRNNSRAVLRGAVRRAVFNRWTVPLAQRWLGRQQRNTAVTRWMYWKVLLHHTNHGYATAPVRKPQPVPLAPWPTEDALA